MAFVLQIAPKLASIADVGIGGAVLILSLGLEYFTQVKPSKDFYEIVPFLMDEYTASLCEFLREQKINPRMNVMIPQRVRRCFWLRRYFVIYWTRGMTDQPDVNIAFPISRGIAGECYRRKKSMLAGPEILVDARYALPDELRPLTEHVRAVWSQPIYEPARNGQQSGKLIGILNLDSDSPHAYTVLAAERVRMAVDIQMRKIAVVASQIFH